MKGQNGNHRHRGQSSLFSCQSSGEIPRLWVSKFGEKERWMEGPSTEWVCHLGPPDDPLHIWSSTIGPVAALWIPPPTKSKLCLGRCLHEGMGAAGWGGAALRDSGLPPEATGKELYFQRRFIYFGNSETSACGRTHSFTRRFLTFYSDGGGGWEWGEGEASG